MKFPRRAYFGIAQLFLLMALLAAFFEPTWAQHPDLLQAAKKEAEVVVFGSLENDVAAAINKGFEAKHGIKTNYAARRRLSSIESRASTAPAG